MCNSPGYPSFDPCYSDHSDTDRYPSSSSSFFWTVPWGGISLWITYYPWKKEKKRFLLESSKEEEEEDPSPFRIRVCVPPLLVWNSTNIWLLVPYIYTANTRNYLVRNIFHTNACFFIFLWGIFGLTFSPLSLSSSFSPCSQSPRKTSFALAKKTHPPLSPSTHYHFPPFRRRRRHRLPNEEEEIYILLTRSKGGDRPTTLQLSTRHPFLSPSPLSSLFSFLRWRYPLQNIRRKSPSA